MIKKSSGWDNFDSLAEQMVRRSIPFEEFAAKTKPEFQRLARAAARRRRLPAWVGLEDVANSLVHHAWHYALERVGRNGMVGYVPGMYVGGAGAYIRRKLRQKIGKELSKARGENQSTRTGPRAPEYLSRTGEYGGIGGLPEIPVASETEAMVERAMRFGRLLPLCETALERAILRAIEAGGPDEEIVMESLAHDPDAKAVGVASTRDAKREVDAFIASWKKELGKRPGRRRESKEAAWVS